MKIQRKIKRGISIIEIVVSFILLIMLSFILLRENVTAIRQRMWGVRFVMAQSTLNQYETLANVISKESLDPGNSTPQTNPWHHSTNNATAQTINIGKIPKGSSSVDNPEGTQVIAFVVLSNSPATLGNIDLEQSIIFKSGGFYYRISSFVRR